MNPADLQTLRADVEEYAKRHNGRIYSVIDHPAFADVPAQHGASRFEPIAENMPEGMRTALDIGTHWGYFAHRLEGLGLEVTAAEVLPEYLKFLYRIKDLYGDRFEIYPKSVFKMEGEIKYDVILALYIFHHFIKTESIFAQFKDFLSRIRCKVMFFHAHDPREGQMKSAYRNFPPEEFCAFLLESVPGLTTARQIAQFGNRPLFILQ